LESAEFIGRAGRQRRFCLRPMLLGTNSTNKAHFVSAMRDKVQPVTHSIAEVCAPFAHPASARLRFLRIQSTRCQHEPG